MEALVCENICVGNRHLHQRNVKVHLMPTCLLTLW